MENKHILTNKNCYNAKKSNKCIFYLICFCLFLYAMHFLEQSSIIAVGILEISFLYLLIDDRKVYFSLEFFVLTITMLLYYVIYMYNGAKLNFYNVITYFIAPVGLYFVAYNIIDNIKDMKWVMYSFIFGFFVFGCLNLLNTTSGENWYDVDVVNIWSGETITATLMGPLFSLASALSFYFMFVNKNKFIKILGIFTFVISIVCANIIANRTLLFLTIIMFALSFIVYLFVTNNWKKNCIFIFGILMALGILLLLLMLNVGGIKTTLMNSNLYIRMFGEDSGYESILDTPRYITWMEMMRQFFDYPIGGKHVSLSGGYVHNLWLDVNYQAGWITSLLMICLFIIAVVNVIKFCRNKSNENGDKMFVMIIIITAFINFSLEPVLEGMPLYFICVCVFSGIIKKLNKINNYGTEGNDK